MTDVYRNRTRARGCWSVRDHGRVVGHAPALALAGCRLRVVETARQRVLRTGRREVHAWISGDLIEAVPPAGAVLIGYRPEEAGFRRRDTGAVVTTAPAVFFLEDGSCVALF